MIDTQPHIEAIKQTLNSSHPHPLIFATITGSHAFGYASPLSDFDVHGAHLLSLHHVLGFTLSGETTEMKAIGGEIDADIATHDLKKFLLLLLKGNGNVLEDLYSPLVVTTSPLHEELKALGKGCITKMCANHYKGMAYNQQCRMQKNDIKKLLHTYRCLLMGIHLMRSGELVMDVPTLVEEYQQTQVRSLIEYKMSGVDGLDNFEVAAHLEILESLHERLDSEQKTSQLSDKPTTEMRLVLEDLLIRTRIEAK